MSSLIIPAIGALAFVFLCGPFIIQESIGAAGRWAELIEELKG